MTLAQHTTASTATTDHRDRMLGLLRRRPPRTSLEAPLYTDPDLFSLDMQGIFATQWFFATTEAEIPEPGDYVTVDIGTLSLIIVRDDDGQVNALHNVCRHRGARVMTDRRGTTARLTCAYHSWTYATDGTLLHASSPGETFDRTCFSLRTAHVRSVCGLVFVCTAAEPPTDIDDLAATVTPYLAGFDIASAKVATRIDLMEEGNWKLTMENNRECYHCGGHPRTRLLPLRHLGAHRGHRPAGARCRLGPFPSRRRRPPGTLHHPRPALGHRGAPHRPRRRVPNLPRGPRQGRRVLLRHR